MSAEQLSERSPIAVDALGTTRAVTVSVGVAAADRALAGDAGEASGKDESAVVHHADRALYQAKIERNRVEVYAGA